ncbi:4-carboxymuconolactone decarboxylase [Mycobacterium uberis]|uniref:4-carboxymuconolactone decarboxylase n=1 Tax=Mycobacterium uberis TaxID=2162698 RepID=A0A3E1HIN8_9MYCO|nr:carboxymuconolactone decarboxylase family protein [Mycobacterium uberis]RFD26333.1 4-carboxymuconolactone decarboxylase [Mycobacterium uberis]
MSSGTDTGPVGHIPSGGLRQLGPINWIIAKLAARSLCAPEMHLFTILGQRQVLFWTWLAYGGQLLSGKLPRVDTELVILRVAHLRACEYELQHHRGMARKKGLDANMQAMVFAWPDVHVPAGGGLSVRQQALLAATDEFIKDRKITNGSWQQLATHLDRHQLIEFCMLISHYDGLAATISSLDIPLDNPR